MGNKRNEYIDDEDVTLSKSLLDLFEQSQAIADEMARVIGILKGMSKASNKYELIHRIKSLTGRSRSMEKMLRRWIYLLEPLDKLSVSMGG